MALGVLHDSFFAYEPDFLPPTVHRRVLAFLASVPTMAPTGRPATDRFALAPPVADDVVVEGRLEGAAGWPVWIDGEPGSGVATPPELLDLAIQVEERLVVGDVWAKAGEEPSSFTSVYVDRYPAHGRFVPHTDRTCYGQVVAGVSVGRGSCRIRFESASGQASEFTVAPGSLYAFAGELRYPPYTHSVDAVTDVRYGVTFRSGARDLAVVDSNR